VFSKIKKLLFNSISLPFFIVIILMILSSILTINITRKKPELFGLLKGPSIIQKEEEELIRKVGSLISLPEGEKPSVATVSDQDKLTSQAFFANALNNDKVIIYTEAKKVILYRPSENRVVEVGTVNIQQNENIEEKVEKKNEDAKKFVILNGTSVSGLTTEMENELKSVFAEAQIVEKKNSNIYYDKTVLIDLKGNSDQAQNLAKDLGIELADFPKNEDEPEDADFMIVVGSDKALEEPAEETS